MKFASDFRADARAALSGHWGIALLTAFVASLLGVSAFYLPTININLTDTYVYRAFSESMYNSYFWHDVSAILAMLSLIAIPFAIISTLWGLGVFIVGSAVEVGNCAFNLNLVSRYNAKFEHLFSYFNIFGRAFCCRLLRAIYTALWTMLLVIPGIVKSYSYAMAPYILATYPDTDANEAITRSRELMRGNKGRLFCLDFSFIGWWILCVLSLGIGFLWLHPYINAAHAAFYLEISGAGAARAE